jgi:hypothetical protein
MSHLPVVTLSVDPEQTEVSTQNVKVWQTPEIKSLAINVDTKVLCDASHPCD